MGYVYAPEAVRLRRVPKLENYGRLIKITRERLPGIGLIGGVIGGSAIIGQQSIRSDLDLFALSTAEHIEDVLERVSDIVYQATQWHIGLRPSLLDFEVGRTTLHHLDAGFYAHLQWAARNGGVIGEDPLPRIQSQHLSPREGACHYLTFKSRSLSIKRSSFRGMPLHERLDALQTALESPIHVARKVLEAYGHPFEDTKACVQEVYRRHFPAHAEKLDALVTCDAWYTGQLIKHLRKFELGPYEEVLRALEPCLKTSFYFVRDNLLMLAHN
ncbi:MAG TPA: hypothetical protein VGE59_03700 [Patescibacteria group bacterium]